MPVSDGIEPVTDVINVINILCLLHIFCRLLACAREFFWPGAHGHGVVRSSATRSCPTPRRTNKLDNAPRSDAERRALNTTFVSNRWAELEVKGADHMVPAQLIWSVW